MTSQTDVTRLTRWITSPWMFYTLAAMNAGVVIAEAATGQWELAATRAVTAVILFLFGRHVAYTAALAKRTDEWIRTAQRLAELLVISTRNNQRKDQE